MINFTALWGMIGVPVLGLGGVASKWAWNTNAEIKVLKANHEEVLRRLASIDDSQSAIIKILLNNKHR
jgi:hypothetical protein